MSIRTTMFVAMFWVTTCVTAAQSQIAVPQRVPDDTIPLTAHEKGYIEAERDILKHAVSFYSYGLAGKAGWFDTTGFPNRPGIGCVVSSEFLSRARGYEECVRNWVSANGIPSWSRRPWLEMLRSPKAFFWTLAERVPVEVVSVDSACPSISPDGRWKIFAAFAKGHPFPLLSIRDSSGSSVHCTAYLKPEPFQAYFYWGPEGSDVIVLRIEVPQLAADPEYGRFIIVDLRTGISTAQSP